jgi:2-polyprenyl-6-methoxyphenol hydroxylase-like FAD-dependent oxidoreductase
MSNLIKTQVLVIGAGPAGVAAASAAAQAGASTTLIGAEPPGGRAGWHSLLPSKVLLTAADSLGRRPPQRHVPIPVLAALLRLPGMPRLMNTWPEALHFIQTTRFDTTATDAFLAQQGLPRPAMAAVIARSARWYQQQRHGQADPSPA